jgi:hypothetical protein
MGTVEWQMDGLVFPGSNFQQGESGFPFGGARADQNFSGAQYAILLDKLAG